MLLRIIIYYLNYGSIFFVKFWIDWLLLYRFSHINLYFFNNFTHLTFGISAPCKQKQEQNAPKCSKWLIVKLLFVQPNQSVRRNYYSFNCHFISVNCWMYLLLFVVLIYWSLFLLLLFDAIPCCSSVLFFLVIVDAVVIVVCCYCLCFFCVAVVAIVRCSFFFSNHCMLLSH